MEIRSVSSTTVNRPTVSSLPEAVAGGGDSTGSTATAKTASGAGGYISPFLRYDQGARVAVLLFRDVDTGETQDQIPSQRVVEEYRRAAGRLNQGGGREAEAARPDKPASGDGKAATLPGDSTGDGGPSAPPRGISFAYFAPAASTTPAAPAPTPSVPSPSVPTPALGGSLGGGLGGGSFGGGSPGGLVSVTV